MPKGKRPILTLKGKASVDPKDDRPIELGVYDILLPCRQFAIEHKVAEVGRVSLTAEFFLRFLKSIDGMNEESLAAFFGFDRRDMSFVLAEVEGRAYVARENGRLWLTPEGHALFRDEATQPEIFAVERRRETVGFDLIALAPQDRRFLERFELRLPELPLTNPENAASATQQIPRAFRKFYTEIITRRDPSATTKRALYSIDDVAAKERFSAVVRILLRSTAMRPSNAEPDLSDWRPDYEREDRFAIIEAASRFVDKLKIPRRPDDPNAYQALIELAPEFLKEFTRRDGLSLDRYFREATERAGEIRIDRPTAPLLGSLFTKENVRRLFEVARYGRNSITKPPSLGLWIAPSLDNWGATTALPAILAHIKKQTLTDAASDPAESQTRTIALVVGRAQKYLEEAFDVVKTSDAPAFPAALELLLIPRILIAAIVHAPIGAFDGAAVPLGFISFDGRVIARAHRYLMDRIAPFGLSDDVHRALREEE